MTPEELEALKTDAARYRWIRAAWLEGADTGEDSVSMCALEAVYTEAETDAAIDEAIAATATTSG